jgi:hypothetical protein
MTPQEQAAIEGQTCKDCGHALEAHGPDGCGMWTVRGRCKCAAIREERLERMREEHYDRMANT